MDHKRRLRALTSQAKFKAWLKADIDGVAGAPRNPCYCPISTYLINSEYDCVTTYPTMVKCWTGEKRIEMGLPEWAVKFVAKVDISKRNELTRKQALELLIGRVCVHNTYCTVTYW